MDDMYTPWTTVWRYARPRMPELLPRFRASMERVEDDRRIAKILLEGDEVEPVPGMPLRRSADGHNRDRRCGLPLITRGIGGTSPGTDPVAELLAKEARGKLR